MKALLFVILGSTLGGALRYAMANFFYHHLGREFPWGTLIVNWIGCFLIGLIFVLIITKFHIHENLLHSLLITGFLGGFTTFSAFSFEAVTLMENLLYGRALAYILSSVAGGIILTGLGILLGKRIV
jgi:CrcB protein